MATAAIANSTGFTPEQTRYLEGFFAGVAERTRLPFVGHMASGQITDDPSSGLPNLAAEEPMFFNTPVSDLCKEERWKYEENGLDVWDKLLEHANENRAPDPDNLFRFKFHGLFYVAPAQDAFMMRLRSPGGVLTTRQLRGLAEIAADWGSGRSDLTTRANLQIREFAPKNIVKLLLKLRTLGLTSRGSGADNIRNVTASPISGLDREELYDVGPLADAMHYYILNSRDMYGLPRKFNIAFDNGGAISVVADTNDIGFIATRVAEGREVPAGVYFRVMLCGITGHKQLATDCGLLLRADQTVAVAAAMVHVFADHGDRTDRKKARLKYLVDKWGVEKFLEETEKRLAFPLIRVPESVCEPRKPINRWGHLGVHAQVQPGLSYIGVVVPVGRFPVAQMHAVAEIADHFGNGQVRLTVWQNLLIPNIPNEKMEAVKAALAAAGLAFTAGTVMSGTVACTGNKGCKFSAADTKRHAVELANFLDARHKMEQPVNLHVTGCSHSCAQHYIGDIGMMGAKVGGEEGYQVAIGGGSDNDRGIARELLPATRFEEIPPQMDRLFAAYMARRAESETFLEFSRRHTIEELRAFCAAESTEQVTS